MIKMLMRGLRIGFALVALAYPALAGPGVQTACTAGTLTCTNDTANARNLATIIADGAVQQRFFDLYMGQCGAIYAEATSVTGHANRVTFCQSMAAGNVARSTLVSAVVYVGGTIGATIQSQLLCTQGTANDGCLVDADVNTAIGAVLTVGTGGGLVTRAWP